MNKRSYQQKKKKKKENKRNIFVAYAIRYRQMNLFDVRYKISCCG